MQWEANRNGVVPRLETTRMRIKAVLILGLVRGLWMASLSLLAAVLGSPNNDRFAFGSSEVATMEGSKKDIVAAGLARRNQSVETTSSPVQSSSGDWPMLQHDPQRSGYTNQEVRPPYGFLRRWHAPPLASRTQPVVAGGILSIGSLNGKMYALDAMTGEITWTYQTGGPIRHSAAVVGGKVFFGSHDKNIYALDAASGGLAWAFRTGAGISAAAVVAHQRVYIGSRDGFFYALDADTGQMPWHYESGGPERGRKASN
jgi:outer membrane protein assembly factor BamB